MPAARNQIEVEFLRRETADANYAAVFETKFQFGFRAFCRDHDVLGHGYRWAENSEMTLRGTS